MSKVVVSLQQEDRFAGQFVPVFDAHLSALDQAVLLQGAQVVGDQLLALFEARGEFSLRGELAQATVLVEQVQDLALQALGVGRKGRDGEVLFVRVWMKLTGERVEPNESPVSLPPNVLFSLQNAKVMRDLAVAHVQRAHEGTEVAPRIGRVLGYFDFGYFF